MQRNTKRKPTISRKVYGRSLTLRIDETIHGKLEKRAAELTHTSPGMNYTVSDVIRMVLAEALMDPSRDVILDVKKTSKRQRKMDPEIAPEDAAPAPLPEPNTET